ncbi:MAG TPA: diacylglycerol kinase family protein [Kiritimatiellia bacterium]|nr:diacylglycerol kinase family protein [Kiritimatiellia bacterium]HMP00698.1 diacylglycerol kinase family protein [Kiritimatiellia bacterium]HMP97940.1 diacylglycerol kinase family protein [Kiritimatiellia bacterium]
MEKVLVIVNPNAGFGPSLGSLAEAVEQAWADRDALIAYQISHDVADGHRKARQAVADGVDTVLVAGGDGMINTIGSELIGTRVALGVLPAGSGNGFARHFEIPLTPEKAARALVNASRRKIDVGFANGRPFFVTCGMAADASLVRTFEKMPMRGILPYVFAAAYEFIEYKPTPFEVVIDDGMTEWIDNPLVFTVANLTQYGGGARIAPLAREDDGILELVVIPKAEAPAAVAGIARLFDGSINTMSSVLTRCFRTLRVTRRSPAPIQVDGELVEAPAEVFVEVRPEALTVLIPDA